MTSSQPQFDTQLLITYQYFCEIFMEIDSSRLECRGRSSHLDRTTTACTLDLVFSLQYPIILFIWLTEILSCCLQPTRTLSPLSGSSIRASHSFMIHRFRWLIHLTSCVLLNSFEHTRRQLRYANKGLRIVNAVPYLCLGCNKSTPSQGSSRIC
jgi:hypothetical protein